MNYLNTKPLLYGIKRHAVLDQIELTEDYPSRVAKKLIDDEVDVGLVPVAVIPKLKEWHIVSDYGIACDGPVASVCIFSDVPMEEVEEMYLDYQSRTSVNLAQVLLREYWKKDVKLIDARGEDFRERIFGKTAGVVIGDRALEQRSRSKYIYDLGEAWKLHTGLPFVFAAWIANKKVSEEFVRAFNEANGVGLNHLDEVIAENPYPHFDLQKYYSHFVDFKLDQQKRQGMELFLEKLGNK